MLYKLSYGVKVGIVIIMLIIIIICMYRFYKQSCSLKLEDTSHLKDINIVDDITGIIQIGAHTGEEAEQHYNSVGENMSWMSTTNLAKLGVTSYARKLFSAAGLQIGGIKRTNNSVKNKVNNESKKKMKKISSYFSKN